MITNRNNMITNRNIKITNRNVMITISGLRIMYVSNRNWGLWASTNFTSNEWKNLGKSWKELKSLDKFKKAIRNVTI